MWRSHYTQEPDPIKPLVLAGKISNDVARLIRALVNTYISLWNLTVVAYPQLKRRLPVSEVFPFDSALEKFAANHYRVHRRSVKMPVVILLSDAKMTKARKPFDATHLSPTPTDNLDLEAIQAFTEENEKVVMQNNLFRISQAMIKVSLIPVSLSAMLLGQPSVSSNAADTHQWIRVTSDNFNNAWYVDKKIENRGQYHFYWVKYVRVKSGVSVPKLESLYYSIDCKSKQRRLRAWIYYDDKNKIMSSNNQPSQDVETIPPKTSAMVIANYVCSHK